MLLINCMWLKNVGNEDEEMSRELGNGRFPLKIIIFCPMDI